MLTNFYFFLLAETTTFREWVHYRYGTYSEVGFDSDPLYPEFYQSGPQEKQSVGCQNLTLVPETENSQQSQQPGGSQQAGSSQSQLLGLASASVSVDQTAENQQMVDASILRNKVRN